MKGRDMAVDCWRVSALVFVTGVSLGLVELALRLLLGRGLPRWSLLTYIGAAFALGFAYILGEALWRPIGRVLVDRDKITDPLWKRSLRLLVIFAILGTLIAGGMLVEQHGWLSQLGW